VKRNSRPNEMRKNPTDAERRMWRSLRDRQLGGYKFRRQMPIGPYIADFACVQARVVVEVDGSQHLESVEYDQERHAYLQAQGYKVVRFWNHDVLKHTNVVLEKMLGILEQRKFEIAEEE